MSHDMSARAEYIWRKKHINLWCTIIPLSSTFDISYLAPEYPIEVGFYSVPQNYLVGDLVPGEWGERRREGLPAFEGTLASAAIPLNIVFLFFLCCLNIVIFGFFCVCCCRCPEYCWLVWLFYCWCPLCCLPSTLLVCFTSGYSKV